MQLGSLRVELVGIYNTEVWKLSWWVYPGGGLGVEIVGICSLGFWALSWQVQAGWEPGS